MCFASAPNNVPPPVLTPLKNLYDCDYYILTSQVFWMWDTMVDYSRSMVTASIPVFVAHPLGNASKTPEQSQAGTAGGDSQNKPSKKIDDSQKDFSMMARLYEWWTWMCQERWKLALPRQRGNPSAHWISKMCRRIVTGYVWDMC